MTTVTGFVKNALGQPVNATVLITPSATVFPYVAPDGTIVTGQPVTVQTNGTDGSWSVALEAGTYTVQTIAPPSLFNITVPNGGGTYTVGQLGNFTTPQSVPVASAVTHGSPLGVLTGVGGTFDDVNNIFWWNPTGTANGWIQIAQSP